MCGDCRRVLDPDNGWRWVDCPACSKFVLRAIAPDGTETELDPVCQSLTEAQLVAHWLASRSLWGRFLHYCLGNLCLPLDSQGVGIFRQVSRASQSAPHGYVCLCVVPVGRRLPEAVEAVS